MSHNMQTFRITDIVAHHDGLKSFYVERPFRLEPGQFVTVWLPGIDEKPFSVSDMTANHLEITVKAVGPFTKELMNRRKGEYIGLRGPFGKGFSLKDDTLLVGGGIGMAPLRFLARALGESGKRFRLLFGVRTAADLPFQEYYRSLPGCTIVSEDGSIGNKGLVTQFMDPVIEEAQIRHISAAGPERMLMAVRDFSTSRHIPYELSFERYMKCGIGICGQCCMDGSGLRLCVDGPVLTARKLAPITEIGLPHRTASGRRP